MKHLKVKMFVALLGVACLGTGLTAGAAGASRVNAGISSEISGYLYQETVSLMASTTEYSSGSGITSVMKESLSKVEDGNNQTEDTKSSSDVKICGYKNIGITTVHNSLNIRKNPSETSKIVGKLPKNGGCEVLKIKDEWIKIKSGKVTGWVSKDYMLTGEVAENRAKKVADRVATVDTQTLFVRKHPNTSSSVIAMVAGEEELEVIKKNDDGWYKVSIDNEKGWVSGDYVDIAKKLPKAATLDDLSEEDTDATGGSAIVAYALQFVGNPYVWGGTSLTNGADCSGFTMSIYAHFGIGLPHYSGSQAGCGTRVSASEARPGDLFFYGSGSSISHVAIYMGGGQIVHASSPSTGIKISNAFYRDPICVVRLIP